LAEPLLDPVLDISTAACSGAPNFGWSGLADMLIFERIEHAPIATRAARALAALSIGAVLAIPATRTGAICRANLVLGAVGDKLPVLAVAIEAFAALGVGAAGGGRAAVLILNADPTRIRLVVGIASADCLPLVVGTLQLVRFGTGIRLAGVEGKGLMTGGPHQRCCYRKDKKDQYVFAMVVFHAQLPFEPGAL
jgi:hypothetical protein